MARSTDTVVSRASEDFGYSDKTGRIVGAGAMILRETNGQIWLAVYSTRNGEGFAGGTERRHASVADAGTAMRAEFARKRRAAAKSFAAGDLSITFEPAEDPNAWIAADAAMIAKRRRA